MEKKKSTTIFDGFVIQNASIAEQVAGIIRTKIISGELPPGAALNEVEMSKALAVSKNTIREAFMILGNEGIVIKQVNKSTNVVTFSKDDVKEIFSLRLAIEKLCAELCVKKGTVPVEKLEQQIKMLQSLVADGKTTEYKEFEENDLLFHELIIIASGNKRALQVWNDLKSQMQVLFFSQLKNYPHTANSDGVISHDNILELLKKSDVSAVHEVLTEHIECGIKFALGTQQLYKKAE